MYMLIQSLKSSYELYVHVCYKMHAIHAPFSLYTYGAGTVGGGEIEPTKAAHRAIPLSQAKQDHPGH